MSAVIDTAIGLILMYLVLSLFCTTLNEMIANAMKLRATTLKAALDEIIDDPNVKALFYNHGLIDGAKVAATGGDSKPSPTTPAAQASTTPHPSYLSGKNVALALIDSVIYIAKNDAKLINTTADFESAIKTLPDSNVRDALMSCVAEAGNEMAKLRDAIASWFDSSMDRLSGDYKRNLQRISVAVGLVLAIIFNADTLHVARALWNDPALSSIAAQAGADVVRAGQAYNVGTAENSACGKLGAGDFEKDTNRLCQLNSDLRPLPIGWDDSFWAWVFSKACWQWLFSAGFVHWLFSATFVGKILGLAMTTVALTLGAPFWFDLLSQFVNLRGTGAKPQSSTS